ncbi:MAG: hypothetical protein RLZZ46_783, partial [Bacteroidota bacterium]
MTSENVAVRIKNVLISDWVRMALAGTLLSPVLAKNLNTRWSCPIAIVTLGP